MYVDPNVLSWLLIGAASVIAFMIGRHWELRTQEETINDTIVFLINNNFINARKGSDGEWEIIDLDGEP